MTDKRIVMTTAGSVDEARRIAETLVDRKLAACVNIVPKVVSIYRWKGKVEEAEEWLLWIKTAAPFENVRDAILEMHSYELPECLSLSIEDASPAVSQVAGRFGEVSVRPQFCFGHPEAPRIFQRGEGSGGYAVRLNGRAARDPSPA